MDKQIKSLTINGVKLNFVPIYKNIRTGQLQLGPSIHNLPEEFVGYMLKQASPTLESGGELK